MSFKILNRPESTTLVLNIGVWASSDRGRRGGGGDGCESLANTSIPEKVLYVESPSKKLIGLICATFQCETIASELGKKELFPRYMFIRFVFIVGKEHSIIVQENLTDSGTFWAKVTRARKEEDVFVDAMVRMG